MNWKKILIGEWNWKRPIISLASIYLLLAIIAVFFANHLIFVPPAPSYDSDYPGLRFIKTPEDETIAFLHLPAKPGMPTILYSHGNAEDLAQSRPIYDEFRALGLGVLAYDYPGYGLSTGKPSEASAQRSIMTVWKHLISSGIPSSSILIAGRSVGSGPSVWLACQTEPAGLLLFSPFKSTFTTAFDLPFPLFPRDRFPNLKRIRSIHCPLLIIHGEEDDIIPASHGLALLEACPTKEKSFVSIPAASHNDLFAVGAERIFSEVAGFAHRGGE